MRRLHLCTGWLAVVALLIGGLAPTAISAQAVSSGMARAALCRGVAGAPLPVRPTPTLPSRQCATCTVCTGSVSGVLPARPAPAILPFAAAGRDDAAHGLIIAGHRAAHPAAQPRAPPRTAC